MVQAGSKHSHGNLPGAESRQRWRLSRLDLTASSEVLPPTVTLRGFNLALAAFHVIDFPFFFHAISAEQHPFLIQIGPLDYYLSSLQCR